MTAGFQAFTDTGLVQIDGTTPNFVLRQSATVVAGSGNINIGKSNAGKQWFVNCSTVSFTFAASMPLVALYSPTAYVAMLHCVSNGDGTWTILLWSSQNGAAIGIYIFDTAPAVAPSGAGYGMQIYDGGGSLIYDARQRIARVLDTQSGNVRNASPGWGQWDQVDSVSQSWSYPVSKVGVAGIGTAFLGATFGNQGDGWYDISGFQTSGGSVNFLFQYHSNGSGSHPNTNSCFGSQYDWRFMAIDLSNI